MIDIEETKSRRRWTRPLGPLAFWLLLAAFWTSVLWPTAYGGDTGGSEEIAAYESTVLRLHRASTDGREARGSLSERQINAYLDAVLDQHRHPGPKRRPMEIERVRFDIGEGETELAIAGRLFGLGFVIFNQLLECPNSADAAVCLEPTRVGRLPLPAPLNSVVRQKVLDLFAGLQTEREVLRHLERIEFADERLQLRVDAGSGSQRQPIRSSNLGPRSALRSDMTSDRSGEAG